MAMDLQQLLRSLCFNTDWKYAVFWKLKHRARMVLTLEDAYYDNHEYYQPPEKQCSGKSLGQLHGGNFSNDLLGLALAKMSYRVYSLGEGIVGQVAVTGKYQWISADDLLTSSSSLFEYSDGWQCQFSAGIRTVVVIAVVPLGVIQLGSLHRVIENMDVVSNIRNLFLSLQDYSVDHVPNPMHCSMRSSMSVPDVSTKNLALENFPDCFDVEKDVKTEKPGFCSPFPSAQQNCMPSGFHGSAVESCDKYGELDGDDNSCLLQSTSDIMQLDNQKFVDSCLLKEKKYRWENSGHNDIVQVLEKNVSSLLDNTILDNGNLHELISLSEKTVFDPTCSSQALLGAVSSENNNQHGLDTDMKDCFNYARQSDGKSQNSAQKFECEAKACHRATSCSSLNFPLGCELHEALGPAFLKRWNYLDWEGKETKNVELPEMADGSSTSQLTSESCTENLLEAIVANICHSNNDVKSEISFSTSVQSPLESGKSPEVSRGNLHMINSESCSLEQRSLSKEDRQPCLSSSGIGDLMSQKGFSSTCNSTCSEQYERTTEPAKNGKKRARPGESCRPRPRDRQLIQDRIKELRELVPNGAKCSIDSLLERTIKHMLFLQSITKHADKLNNCADSKIKLQDRKTDSQGSSSYDQGSSWAMEVGGHLKVHSILVENLNKNGQMFVEMLCEDCSHFLEIAQAIRSLGLTILKGATEAHSEKTWMCFLVEGQSNRNMHRLDILWPLVQMLQSKSAPQQS